MTGGGSARDPLSRVAAKTTNAAPKSQSGSSVAGRRKRNDAAASAAGRRTRIAPEVIGPFRPYENEAAAACERTVRIRPALARWVSFFAFVPARARAGSGAVYYRWANAAKSVPGDPSSPVA